MVLLLPHKGYIMARYYMFMKKIEIDNVEIMLQKPIDSFGRISGLSPWKNRKAVVLILNNEVD